MEEIPVDLLNNLALSLPKLEFRYLIYALSDTTWKATVLVRSLKLSPVGRG